jgi:hypothetical protein
LESVAKAEKLGGKILVPKMAVPKMGYFALCMDTAGNIFGLWENDPQAKIIGSEGLSLHLFSRSEHRALNRKLQQMRKKLSEAFSIRII